MNHVTGNPFWRALNIVCAVLWIVMMTDTVVLGNHLPPLVAAGAMAIAILHFLGESIR